MHGIDIVAYLPAATPSAIFGPPYAKELMETLIPHSHTISRQGLLTALGANSNRKLVLSQSASCLGATNLFLMDINEHEHQVVAARVVHGELPSLDTLAFVSWHSLTFPSNDLAFLAYHQGAHAGGYEYSW